jgi:hypothetical protein
MPWYWKNLIKGIRMHFYSCSAGNPEGTDFSLHLCSQQEYSKEDFQVLCETLIIETLEEEYQERKYAFINSIDTDILFLKFQSRGFDYVKDTASYYLEPYWSKSDIRLEALKNWCSGGKRAKEIEDELRKADEAEGKDGQV